VACIISDVQGLARLESPGLGSGFNTSQAKPWQQAQAWLRLGSGLGLGLRGGMKKSVGTSRNVSRGGWDSVWGCSEGSGGVFCHF